ncbi:MAG: hypothetical protein A2X13_08240 [Bacteroidetes bacterium GWC2_33_15]|nr:MAG: hypothetical protein A2X10_10070 [Bacteroidetes bacterium GWA2_33_15]OFX51444.1 MAG: hypothetical protein A2X13_08240 [Bacteroidetes bacterium GWC2_33_15]OFX65810.1 MAG: hypothetical protein A2X15_13540 [Bacteroidetes bacterium GWB2_32_14]OFX69472.1 MAG: hypothetical protein A2X14_09820 [Bacteroidetes bacterium GWD2_33_33]HAN17728.1 RNA polymerase subunit sigma-70 [Bacteroidales bacterium]
MSDQELLEKIAQKDEQAFRVFVEKYHVLVLNVCNNILNNYDDSMDISQEVFIKIYESIDKFRGESKISTWLYRIAVNKSLNHLRSKKRQKWFSSLDVIFGDDSKKQEKEIKDNSPIIGEQIEANENRIALHVAINKLPDKQKTAITLNSFEELSYKEIAEVMMIPVADVGVLINRAKQNLNKHIIDYYKNN